MAMELTLGTGVLITTGYRSGLVSPMGELLWSHNIYFLPSHPAAVVWWCPPTNSALDRIWTAHCEAGRSLFNGLWSTTLLSRYLPRYPASTTYHLSSLTLGNTAKLLCRLYLLQGFLYLKKKKSKANPEIAEADFLLSTKTQLHLARYWHTRTHVPMLIHTQPFTSLPCSCSAISHRNYRVF